MDKPYYVLHRNVKNHYLSANGFNFTNELQEAKHFMDLNSLLKFMSENTKGWFNSGVQTFSIMKVYDEVVTTKVEQVVKL